MNSSPRFTIRYTVDNHKKRAWRIIDNHTRRLAVPRAPNKQSAIEAANLLNSVHTYLIVTQILANSTLPNA